MDGLEFLGEDPPSPVEVFFSNFAPENGSGFEDAFCFLNQGNYISNFEGYICIYRICVLLEAIWAKDSQGLNFRDQTHPTFIIRNPYKEYRNMSS